MVKRVHRKLNRCHGNDSSHYDIFIHDGVNTFMKGKKKKIRKSKKKVSRRPKHKRKKIAGRSPGAPALIFTKGVTGMDGKKKKRKGKRRHGLAGSPGRVRRYGDPGTGRDIMTTAGNVLTALVGGIGGSWAGNKIPLDPKIKPVIPLVVGLVLSMWKRSPAMLKMAGFGMSTVAGMSIFKQLFPTVPVLAGESRIMWIPESAIAEARPSLLGAPASFAGEPAQFAGFKTPATV